MIKLTKEGIRVIGIDDSPFDKQNKSKKVLVIGVIYRQNIVEGILSTHITRDGTDSTLKLQKMISESRFSSQIKIILLHGTMMAGLNVIDIQKLSENLKLPVIAVTKTKPDMKSVYDALKKANPKTFEMKKKIIERIAEKCGEFEKTNIKGDKYYIQSAGMTQMEAADILSKFGIESLRLAHIIGSGIVKGESSGRI